MTQDEEIIDLRIRTAVLEEKAAQHDKQLQSNQWAVATVIAAAGILVALLALFGVHI